ncbi:hypothetical protein BS50DRAFT_635260 [Corynespora cassiicola Philippines]|uniref:SRR1-like domain-containing protein n=1 Tax=Corynespora cassiicola Philippines TaxID=1448308 RepID=A0A2T2NKY2_CORCC|nr:hypothetical protein BS50DRAFT_635260 [Corynespora cassiicola Philippines]
MSFRNMYEVLEDKLSQENQVQTEAEPMDSDSDSDSGSESSFSHEDEDNLPDPWSITRVDLGRFESYVGGRPIFSKDLLRQVSEARKRIIEGKYKTSLEIPDVRGQLQVIWQPPEGGREVESVTVEFLNHVELHPGFNPPECSPTVKLLQKYNGHTRHIPSPIVLRDTPGVQDLEHLGEETIKSWNAMLVKIAGTWRASLSRKKLLEKLAGLMTKNTKITKIVGFGLGSLEMSGDKQHILQYLTAATIAGFLNQEYRRLEPNHEDMEIALQDPAYTSLDRYFLPRCYGRTRIVENPDGFLEIDEHTLVMAPFLPIEVPFLQICADIPGGPAGIFCNKIGSSKRPGFSIHQRSSPRVEKMLEGYDRIYFRDHFMEEDVRKAVDCKHYWYWLTGMQLHLRRRQAETDV